MPRGKSTKGEVNTSPSSVDLESAEEKTISVSNSLEVYQPSNEDINDKTKVKFVFKYPKDFKGTRIHVEGEVYLLHKYAAGVFSERGIGKIVE